VHFTPVQNANAGVATYTNPHKQFLHFLFSILFKPKRSFGDTAIDYTEISGIAIIFFILDR